MESPGSLPDFNTRLLDLLTERLDGSQGGRPTDRRRGLPPGNRVRNQSDRGLVPLQGAFLRDLLCNHGRNRGLRRRRHLRRGFRCWYTGQLCNLYNCAIGSLNNTVIDCFQGQTRKLPLNESGKKTLCLGKTCERSIVDGKQ